MSKAEPHYDTDYFRSRYSHIIGSDFAYQTLAAYWMHVVLSPVQARLGQPAAGRLLDYGCGTGVVSGAWANSDCFDIASTVQEFLRSKGRRPIGDKSAIPDNSYDYLLCSHSLEHYEEPRDALIEFRRYILPSGVLVLVLPIETDFAINTSPDVNQHLYCWTFQSISNLLRVSGWNPVWGTRIHGPFLLKTLARFLPLGLAVRIATVAGRAKNEFPSMLVAARLSDEKEEATNRTK